MATEKSALLSVIDRLVRRLLPDFGHQVTPEDPELAFLKDLAFKDEVTGLYNRRFFSIRLEEEISRYRRFNHPVSVLLLDLDDLQAINDNFGYAAGDETLHGMAELLLWQTRGINVVCRYGGARFGVLLVETSRVGAQLYADRIRHVLSSYEFAHRRRVTASFAITSLP